MSALSLAQQLSTLLANTFVFSQQLHGFHWTYTGQGFVYLHPFLGDDYEDTYGSVDNYAEEILTLNFEPPTRLSEYLSLSTSIKEVGKIEDPKTILHIAYSGHNILGGLVKEVFKYAEQCEANDIANYLAERQAYHFKKAWFYRAELGIKVPSIFEASKAPLQTQAPIPMNAPLPSQPY